MLKTKKYIKENYLLIIMFAVLSVIEIAVILPIMYKTRISYDSSYQYGLTQHTIPEIWRLLPADYSPPFYAIALKLYCMVFGHSLIVMRTFSIIAVVGMLFVAAFPVNTLFNKKTAMYCMMLTFCSTAILELMNEVRPTILAMFFYMAVTVYAGIAYSTGNRYSYICLVVFSLLSMYTHNVAMVGTFSLYAALLLFSAIKRDRKKLRNFFICGGICGILYLPWLRIILSQTSEVQEHFWSSGSSLSDVINWVFTGFQGSYKPLYGFIVCIAFSITLFSCILSHMDFKKMRGAKKFKATIKIPQEKKVYINILLIFTAIIVSIFMMEIVALSIRNIRAQRYYYIFGAAFIVVPSAVLANFGNKICCSIYLCVLLVNHSGNAAVIKNKSEFNRSTIDIIVSEINERSTNEEISFFHAHEWSLGIMSYYFPDAKHYVYDETYTVLRDFGVFGTDIINVGDLENICNYTDKFYVFSKIYEQGDILDDFVDMGNCEVSPIAKYKMTYDYFGFEKKIYEIVLTSDKDTDAE